MKVGGMEVWCVNEGGGMEVWCVNEGGGGWRYGVSMKVGDGGMVCQ